MIRSVLTKVPGMRVEGFNDRFAYLRLANAGNADQHIDTWDMYSFDRKQVRVLLLRLPGNSQLDAARDHQATAAVEAAS